MLNQRFRSEILIKYKNINWENDDLTFVFKWIIGLVDFYLDGL